MRQVKVRYIATKEKYTIGKLYIDGEYMCDTLTPPLRKDYIRGSSSVPRGKYKLSMEYVSPRFSGKEPYRSVAKGKVPRVTEFRGSQNILFHCGNIAEQTEGCFLLGQNTVVGKVLNSQVTYKRVVPILAMQKEWEFVVE